MVKNGGVSHWYSRLPDPRPALPGDREADICTVSYTHLTLPTKRIV